MYLTYTNWNFELVVWIPARDPLAIVDSGLWGFRTTKAKNYLL